MLCKRCQPVLAHPEYNCIKTHDFPRDKNQPGSFVSVCFYVSVLKSLNKIGSLHLVQFNSVKSAQRRADTGSLTHSLALKDMPPSAQTALLRSQKQPIVAPNLFNLCNTLGPSLPHTDFVVAP